MATLQWLVSQRESGFVSRDVYFRATRGQSNSRHTVNEANSATTPCIHPLNTEYMLFCLRVCCWGTEYNYVILCRRLCTATE